MQVTALAHKIVALLRRNIIHAALTEASHSSKYVHLDPILDQFKYQILALNGGSNFILFSRTEVNPNSSFQSGDFKP